MNLSIARKAIERLYIDTCSVIEFQEVTDPETHISGMAEVTVHEDVPCKLSFKTVAQSAEGVASTLSQVIKLIINPEIVIKPGSKVIVTRNGMATAYKCSGEPARHINHQEIMLELEDERA